MAEMEGESNDDDQGSDQDNESKEDKKKPDEKKSNKKDKKKKGKTNKKDGGDEDELAAALADLGIEAGAGLGNKKMLHFFLSSLTFCVNLALAFMRGERKIPPVVKGL